jgi:hypothetical protein
MNNKLKDEIIMELRNELRAAETEVELLKAKCARFKSETLSAESSNG